MAQREYQSVTRRHTVKLIALCVASLACPSHRVMAQYELPLLPADACSDLGVALSESINETINRNAKIAKDAGLRLNDSQIKNEVERLLRNFLQKLNFPSVNTEIEIYPGAATDLQNYELRIQITCVRYNEKDASPPEEDSRLGQSTRSWSMRETTTIYQGAPSGEKSNFDQLLRSLREWQDKAREGTSIIDKGASLEERARLDQLLGSLREWQHAAREEGEGDSITVIVVLKPR